MDVEQDQPDDFMQFDMDCFPRYAQSMIDDMENNSFSLDAATVLLSIYNGNWNNIGNTDETIEKRRPFVENIIAFLPDMIPRLDGGNVVDYEMLDSMMKMSGVIQMANDYPEIAGHLVTCPQFKALEKDFESLRSYGYTFERYDLYRECRRLFKKNPTHTCYNLWKGVTKIGGIDISTLRKEYKKAIASFDPESDEFGPGFEQNFEDEMRQMFAALVQSLKGTVDRIELMGCDNDDGYMIDGDLLLYQDYRREAEFSDADKERLKPFIEKIAPFLGNIVQPIEGNIIDNDVLDNMYTLSYIHVLCEDFPGQAQIILGSPNVQAFERNLDTMLKHGCTFVDYETYQIFKESALSYPTHRWYNLWEGVTEINGMDLEAAKLDYEKRENDIMIHGVFDEFANETTKNPQCDENEMRNIFVAMLQTFKANADRMELLGHNDSTINYLLFIYDEFRGHRELTASEKHQLIPFIEKIAPYVPNAVRPVVGNKIDGAMHHSMAYLSCIHVLCGDFQEQSQAILQSEKLMAIESHFEMIRKNGDYKFVDVETYNMCKKAAQRYPTHSWYNLWEGVTEINGMNLETAKKDYVDRNEAILAKLAPAMNNWSFNPFARAPPMAEESEDSDSEMSIGEDWEEIHVPEDMDE